MERRLAAILYADVAGYSRLVDRDEEGTHRTLKSRLSAFSHNITQNGGRICHFAGDAILAEFQSVTAALTAAITSQDAFKRDENGASCENPFLFRIGVNLGEVIVDGDEIYGTGVNVAVRIQELAEPGGITISGRAKEQIDGAFDIGFLSLGQKRVKNIQNPIHVFRLVTERPSRISFDLSRLMGRVAKPAAIAVTASVLILVTALSTLWVADHQVFTAFIDGEAETSLVKQTRIAVLPFRNASGDAQQDYFAEAISDDLSNALGRFAEFGVIASEAITKNPDQSVTPQELREKFGAVYLLTGSVRRDQNTVRLTTKLVDTSSGLQLWSERYDRSLAELFAVQDEIVRTIAAEASITLTRLESERAFGKPMPDLEAYDLYLRGRAFLARETRKENVEARALFRRAIDSDPQFAPAYVGLGMTHYREATRGWSHFMARNVEEAERFARRALQLDRGSSDAYVLLGVISLLSGEFENAERSLRRSMQLNPNNLQALLELGVTGAYLGRVEQSVEMLERVVSLGAFLNSRTLAILAMGYVLKNDPGKAVRLLESSETQRRDHFYYATLAVAHAELGNDEQAQLAAEQTNRVWPFFSAEAFAGQYQDPKQRERIIDDLRRAGLA